MEKKRGVGGSSCARAEGKLASNKMMESSMGLDTGLLLLDLDVLQLPAEFASPSSSPSSSAAAAASSAVITSTTTSGKLSLSHASRLDDLFAQWLSLPDTQRLVRQHTFLRLLLPSLLLFFSLFFLPMTPKTLTYPLLCLTAMRVGVGS